MKAFTGRAAEPMHEVFRAAAKFAGPQASVAGVEAYGTGIIHDTYLVRLGDGGAGFILQRFNSQVFGDPAAIMHNLQLVTEHIRKKIKNGRTAINPEWQVPDALRSAEGKNLFIDPAGRCWRALSFITDAVSLEQITDLNDAREVGRGLGLFHRLVNDLEPGLLLQTLPGFHNVERYLARYDAALERARRDDEAARFCRRFIAARREWAPVLENGRRNNKLGVRVIHGDPKIDNIMINRTSRKAVSIIDLDTVMPGPVHYDIGDCLRSCCNPAGEDAADLALVSFDLKCCKAVLTGYCTAAGPILTGADFHFLYDAVRLIPFELGVRFFTDFLQGDRYFKVSRPAQNWARALVQFKLVESIEAQEEQIRNIIGECSRLHRA